MSAEVLTMKTAGMRDLFKRISDAPHAIQVRTQLARAAKDSNATHHAAELSARADGNARYAQLAADRLKGARAQAAKAYSEKLPGQASASEAKKAFTEAKAKAGVPRATIEKNP